ncbi:hypothetical protein FF2_018893 [Malus domestica]
MFRLYNQSGSGKPDPVFELKYRDKLKKLCPLIMGQNVTGDLDATPLVFHNQYYKDLVSGRRFLNSYQTLVTYPQTRIYVEQFSSDQTEFFKAFVKGMIKMGDLQFEQPGEVRRNCRVVNRRPVNTHWKGCSSKQYKFEVRLRSLSDICPQEGDTYQSRIALTRLLRLPQ